MPKSFLDKASAAAGALWERHAVSFGKVQGESEHHYAKAQQAGFGPQRHEYASAKDFSNAEKYAEDAFRHSYSSARLTQAYSEPVANAMGRAWEAMAAATRENNDTNMNAKEIGMDLHNNRVGRELIGKLGQSATPEQIRDALVQAGRQGQLIMHPNDPRAMSEYKSSYDIRSLTAINEMASDSHKPSKEFNSMKEDLFNKGADTKAHLMDMFKVSMGDAMRQDPDSPMFKFSDAQLASGAQFAEKMDPQAVASLSEFVAPGREDVMTRGDFNTQMAALEQSISERDLPSFGSQKEFGREHEGFATTVASVDARQARQDDTSSGQQQREAVREMEMDIA